MAASSSDGDPPPSSEDTRFAELLKPIKRLTQNWEVNPVRFNSFPTFLPCMCQVPLLEILSEYIEDLQRVTISLDGGQTSVNFPQAALVLQGTMAVYSKKVEYLYHEVNKMVGRLATNSGQDNVGQEEVEPRVRARGS